MCFRGKDGERINVHLFKICLTAIPTVPAIVTAQPMAVGRVYAGLEKGVQSADHCGGIDRLDHAFSREHFNPFPSNPIWPRLPIDLGRTHLLNLDCTFHCFSSGNRLHEDHSMY